MTSRTSRTPRTLLAAALLLGAALPWGAALAQDGRTIAIQAELHEFGGGSLHMTPPRIDARVGDTLQVEVINRGVQFPHNLVFCGDAPDETRECSDVWARTETLAVNESQTITVQVTKAGTFEYYCDIGQHKVAGMRGELFVQEAPGGSKKETPFMSLPLALLAAAAALLVLRRRWTP